MNIDYEFIIEALPQIIKRLPVTIELFIVSLLISLVFGTLFAFINFRKIKGLSQLIRLYMSLIRGTPVLLQLYCCFHLLPYLINNILEKTGSTFDIYDVNPIYYAFFALSLLATVSISEAIRAGLEGVEKGQLEAGLAVGMSEAKALIHVVLPQTFANAMPVIGNVTVDLIKTTSLAFIMSVIEITAEAKILGGEQLRYFEGYLCVFIIYIFVIKAIEVLMKLLEKKITVYRVGSASRVRL